MKSLIRSLCLLICIIAVSGCVPDSPVAKEAKVATEPFVAHSDQWVGFVHLYVIEHRETGKRYILADRQNGGVFIQPLDSVPEKP